MTRLAEVRVDTLSDEMRAYFEGATPRDKILFTPTAHAPALMTGLHDFADVLAERGTLPGRLVELVRLRIAFHNQCRSCMAIRYQDGIDAGVDEQLVCQLADPPSA